jgi:hypothetical protein
MPSMTQSSPGPAGGRSRSSSSRRRSGHACPHWTGDDQARHDAEGDLERTVEALKEAGLAARGEVGSDDPIEAADDALRTFPADEIVFATHSEHEANWKERGVVEIAQSRYDVPVIHVLVDAG